MATAPEPSDEPPGRPLGPLDEHFLAMDTATGVGHVGGLSIFESTGAPLGAVQMRRLLRERLAELPPLRRRLVADTSAPGRHCWVDDDPDLDVHVGEVELGSGGGSRELGALAARLTREPLDRDRPLWRIAVVRGLPGGGAAVVLKLHHAACDGISAVELWEVLFGGAERDALAAEPWVGGLAVPASDAPMMPGWARAPMPPVPMTRFNGPLCGERDFAYATLPHERFAAIRRASGATLTEAFVAVCAGALRAWLSQRGELPEQPLAAAIPVSLRGAAGARTFDNRLTETVVRLPTQLDDPWARLEASCASMEEARQRARGNGRPLAPDPGPAANLALVTLVGARIPLSWEASPLVASYPIALLAAGGLNITGLTSRGRIDLGVHVDREQGDGGWSIAEAVESALDELHAAAG